jgi:hypothetical protein
MRFPRTIRRPPSKSQFSRPHFKVTVASVFGCLFTLFLLSVVSHAQTPDSTPPGPERLDPLASAPAYYDGSIRRFLTGMIDSY